MAKNEAGFPELREFIKEAEIAQRLYDFCSYMLHGALSVDELVLDICRDFGDDYRKQARRRGATWSASEASEMRIRLFRQAWDAVQFHLQNTQYVFTVGRDTRQMKSLEDDLLAAWRGREKSSGRVEAGALDRLARVDADFRAPLVLRDILKFEDEEVVRILGTRWGVYRHRLHRGRLEFKDSLRGRPMRLEVGKNQSQSA